ncbi:hypothetical protein PQC36_gp073 [Proteus phage Vb_PmiP-P59]|uniref:Uncharacterized protein n=2 Tax=Privateervirus TaxID=2843440 RepID=A0A679FGG1_9CAUD|nr:hypothetical protein HWB19_gp125 [Cronobacter phage vB_CsaP_009]YP_010672200.1 hypothetical protein PQC36_gp073 [Proteus phage Vb_PmiP-P59]QMV48243.1 hypothetical protein [Proteus phage Vb_PmiP-P59]BBU72771.1 hypothetical protein [Cronobacter phage vB_CsaP_009]
MLSSFRFKRCKNCNEMKLKSTSFKTSENSPDGYFPYCDKCVNRLNSDQVQKCKYYRS